MELKNLHKLLTILLTIAFFVLYFENNKLNDAIGRIDAGFIEFMEVRTKSGMRMADAIKPETIGLFKIGKQTIACAYLK